MAACDPCYQFYFKNEKDTDGECVQDRGYLIISDCRSSFRICFCRMDLGLGCDCSSLKGHHTGPQCSWCLPWIEIYDCGSAFVHRMLIGFLKHSQRRDYWVINWMDSENQKLAKNPSYLPNQRAVGQKPSSAQSAVAGNTRSQSNSSLYLAAPSRPDDIQTVE